MGGEVFPLVSCSVEKPEDFAFSSSNPGFSPASVEGIIPCLCSPSNGVVELVPDSGCTTGFDPPSDVKLSSALAEVSDSVSDFDCAPDDGLESILGGGVDTFGFSPCDSLLRLEVDGADELASSLCGVSLGFAFDTGTSDLEGADCFDFSFSD